MKFNWQIYSGIGLLISYNIFNRFVCPMPDIAAFPLLFAMIGLLIWGAHNEKRA